MELLTYMFGSYALTLRIMLANLRRKIGLTSVGTPASGVPTPNSVQLQPSTEGMMVPPGYVDANGVPSQPFTMEELGFTAWPSDRGAFNPSAIPAWLQEQVRDGRCLLFINGGKG
jgi:hypothetical protein